MRLSHSGVRAACLATFSMSLAAHAQTPQRADATVDSTALHTAPTTDPLTALSGKVAGLRVVTTDASPGTAPHIVLRTADATTVADAIVVVDGVVTRLTAAEISTDDIERIEILKGPAAAALYGYEGGNGVVVITTKRSAGNMVTVRTELGDNQLPRFTTAAQHHRYQIDSTGAFVTAGGSRVGEPDLIADNPYPYDNHQAAIIQNRLASNVHASISTTLPIGTALYGSLFDSRDQGIFGNVKGYARHGVRVNLDHNVMSRVALSFGASYVTASYHSSTVDSLMQFLVRTAEPSTPLDSTGVPDYRVPNPASLQRRNPIDDQRSRATMRIAARYDVLSWLRADGTLSRDYSMDTALAPTSFNRHTLVDQRNDRMNAVGFTAHHGLSRSLGDASARLAWIEDYPRLFTRERYVALADTNVFSSVTTFLHPRTTSAVLSTNVVLRGGFAVDALVRRDHTPWIYKNMEALYHRVGTRYTIRGVTLRAATGTAAVPWRDIAFAGSGVFCAPFQPCPAPLHLPFVHESEGGVSFIALRRLDVSYDYARRATSGAAFLVPVPQPSVYTLLWENAANLVGHTHELTLGAALLTRPTLDWRATLTMSRGRTRVARLATAAFSSTLNGSFGEPFFYVAPGVDVGTIYGYRFIRSDAQLTQTLASGHLAGTASDYVRNEDGYFVAAADLHTVNEHPLIAWHCANTACNGYAPLGTIGDMNPDAELGLTSSVRWRALMLRATVDGVVGGDIYNYQRQRAFAVMTDPAVDQSERPPAVRKPVFYYLAFSGPSFPLDDFVEDGSYVRVRELSLDWSLPARVALALPSAVRDIRIGLAARNLITLGDYSGWNPDVTGSSASVMGYRTDANGYPQYRTIVIRLESRAM